MTDAPAPTAAGGHLNDVLGIEWLGLGAGLARARLTVTGRPMSPNGYLHAASIIVLADSACGFDCMRSPPPGAFSFTTIEPTSSFLGAASIGQSIACLARLVQGGRTTQNREAKIHNEATGKHLAPFRCTQLLLYPKA